ncbi:glycosyl transferase [Neptunitalea chrysea]|uniref:Glycosyl transferase n=1 Tax=Neptunitalea chrysea TaxID=1647581 RepID=A0A9W6EVJ4_9FLAO|nr:glycosyltransferase family 4 protein [Neptunitalea chrysea]GLB53899.1 glycosyl transferase [Neptunitalea chrysea]
MKIAFVGTYPPRECGIGTFTQNLVQSIAGNTLPDQAEHELMVLAMNDHHIVYNYPKEVKLIIEQEEQTDYLKAADFINISGADLCILEHEFGIFGGLNGVYILPLLYRVQVPVVVTLHTILENPSYNERAILKEICKMAAKLVVMSQKAVQFLQSIYEVPEHKIAVIEHGVPDLHFDRMHSKRNFKLEAHKVLLTFGFMGRNKGLEIVIKALPEIIRRHPEVLYIVIGKTHPNVLRHSGEEYRNYLQLLIKSLKLSKHVVFLNEFIEETELFKYLAACDIYMTPYVNEAQITSGTLSYALGAGCVVVSTPFWHAAELLAEGRGVLFDFNNTEMLSDTLNHLLDTPQECEDIQERAMAYGRNLIWTEIGKQYAALCQSILEQPEMLITPKETTLDPLMLPPFSLTHIKRLTDDTGIIQHAKFGIPNLKEGYCLDDNARALLMALMTYKRNKDEQALELMPIYLSYIHYMQHKDGTFRNFLSFNRSFLDEVGSEDSFGRTIWALGYLLGNSPNDAYYQTGRLLFFDAAPNFEHLKSIRSVANTIIGICYYLSKNPSDDEMTERLRNLTKKLTLKYDEHHTEDWQWFENLLAYDNAILPLSLLHASQHLNDLYVTKVAFITMDFLTGHTMKEGYLSVIGNKDWFVKDGVRSIFAQQPIDALAMVLMYHQAFICTHDKTFLNLLFSSFMWFLGENDLRMSLYDFETKGCCDGFENYGVNRNQGAESSLAYLMSHLTVLQAHEEFMMFGR